MNQAEKIEGWNRRISYITAVRDHAEPDPETGEYPPEVKKILDNVDWYLCDAEIERQVAEEALATPNLPGDVEDTGRKLKARLIRSRGWHAYWKGRCLADPLDQVAQHHYALLEAEKTVLGWK